MASHELIVRFRVPLHTDGAVQALFAPDILAELESGGILALSWCNGTERADQKIGVLCDRAHRLMPDATFERLTLHVAAKPLPQ